MTTFRSRLLCIALLGSGALLLAAEGADPAAELLAKGRQAQQKKDGAGAAAVYREFLKRFPDHKEAPAAHFGLGLALRDPRANAERLTEAAGHFASAAEGFLARVKEAPKEGELPPELEAAATARCCQAEMLLRLGKTAEARDKLAALLKDGTLGRSHSRSLALYYHGFACLVLKDSLAAGRSLSELEPFNQGAFAAHARYLLGVVHHREEELAEAAGQYEAVIADHAAQRAKAIEALQQPDAFADNPAEKARLEAIAKGPPPAVVGDVLFSLGTLDYEAGRFADAQAHMAAFIKQFPRTPLSARARLINGMCLVRLEQHAEAVEVLGPLAEKEPALAGNALLWLGWAQAGHFDPEDGEARSQALKKAVETLRRAADKFKAPAEASRRGEVFLALAEVLQHAGQAKEAATLLSQVQDDKLLPGRDEEVRQRRLTALNLAGDHAAVLPLCDQFIKSYPKSPLLPEALFRRAESAFFLGKHDDAAKGYRQVAADFPESGHAHAARYGLAWTHCRKGEFDKAQAVLTEIPANERGGELTFVPYLQADCVLRTTPARADDALAAGKLEEQLTRAGDLLADFVALNPDDPTAPDALLRLGLCQQRRAALAGKAEDRNQLLSAARASYERVFIEYPVNELQPYAAFARARCVAAAGDPGEAMGRLRSFTRGPLAKHPAAPLALLLRGTLLRNVENGAPEAVKVLADCRKQHEKELLTDPTRARSVPMLLYHHAVALHEAGRFRDARSTFDELRKQYPDRPEATEAILQWGRALADEGSNAIEKANDLLGKEGISPAAADAARKSRDQGEEQVRAAVRYFEEQAEALKKRTPDAETRAWLLYAAAWGHRARIDGELADARAKRQAQLQEERKLTEPPDVPVTALEVQPSEKSCRALYQTLIDDFSDMPLANDARLELAEVYSQHGEHATAIRWLEQAIDKEPPAELTAKVRLRLAECRAARGDFKGALTQYDAVSATTEGGLAPHGHYRVAECLLRLKDPKSALKRLSAFRDEEPLRTVGGVSDVALLRLGHVYTRLAQWDESQKTFELMLTLFGDDNPWSAEARYGQAWSLLKQKEVKQAQEHFEKASAGEAITEATARARLLVGVCLLERKKYAEALEVLRAIPDKYGQFDYWSSLALVEASHAARLAKQPEEATKLLKRVHRMSQWYGIAQERLKDAKAVSAPHELQAVQQALTPDLRDMPPLDPLGQQHELRASLDDPTEEATQALILARLPRAQRPAAPLQLTLPDPFALRQEPPVRGPLPLSEIPVLEVLPRPRP